MLLHCGLIDLGFMGNRFTWNNGHEGDAYVQQRLDQACVTLEWRGIFPQAQVCHLTTSYLDHIPILLTTQGRQLPRMKRVLKQFKEKWAAHLECETVIRVAWTNAVSMGSLIYNLFIKKKRSCQVALVGWSKSTFRNSKAILEEKHRVLEELMGLNNVENDEAIKRVKEEINTKLYNDELHWCQRSRSFWLKARDKNTKFFHQRASQWRRKNHIGGVFDNDGVWWEFEEGIATVAEKYFKDLFTTTNPSNMDSVLNVVDRVDTPNMNQMLLQPYTHDEDRSALF